MSDASLWKKFEDLIKALDYSASEHQFSLAQQQSDKIEALSQRINGLEQHLNMSVSRSKGVNQ